MKIKKLLSFIIALSAVLMLLCIPAVASEPTDEITDYTMTLKVNDDATLDIVYHIDWLVLDSDELGPVTWLEIGIPNSHCEYYEALSDNIGSLSVSGSMAKVEFKKDYYEGETVSFDFAVRMDYMYQVNKIEEGYTVYSFTPGWFDGVAIDRMKISWDSANAVSWSPECIIDGDALTWETNLGPGERFNVSVSYENEAYAFDLSKSSTEGQEEPETVMDTIYLIIGVILALAIIIVPVVVIIKLILSFVSFLGGSGFGTGSGSESTRKKITRTKIVYYDNCPRCGAPREEGKRDCPYCGGSLVKSEEVLTEEELKDAEKEAAQYKTDGEYQYSSSPNVFVRVVTTPIIVSSPSSHRSSSHRSSSSYRSSSSHRSSGSGGRSCACVSSCACACACACAGGGRAGCTNKDFYNTNLKLKQLEKRSGAKTRSNDVQ